MASKTLEKAYFHIGNGGLTLEVFEDSRGDLFLRSSVSSHGVKASGVAPLPTPMVLSWLQGALSRSRQSKNGWDMFAGGEVSFREGEPTDYGYTHSRPGLAAQVMGTFVRDEDRDDFVCCERSSK